MSKYGIAINAGLCVGCYNCFLTCRDEFAGNEYPGYSAPQTKEGGNWIKVKEVERGAYPHVKSNYVPLTCYHCEEASCVKCDQTGAVYRREDGIVIIDPVKAKGNRDIVNTCPYRRIEWNEEQQVAQKCTMCAHFLDAGNPEPRCVESCPSGALIFGDLDDPNSKISKAYATGEYVPLDKQFELKEKGLYRGLPQKFVAGLVVREDIDEVAVGAKVTLSGPGGDLTTETNGFGDFEFEDLPENVKYSVKISFPGYKEVCLEAKTSKDIYLGEINLKK